MANYTYTDAVGTSRRRARQILIDNPSQPVGATEGMARDNPPVTNNDLPAE